MGRSRVTNEAVSDGDDRKRAEESAIRAAVMEQSADAILLTDSETRFLDANRAATELLGYSKEELLTMKVSDIVPAEELREVPVPGAERLRSGETVALRRSYRRRDGTLVPVEVNIRMVDPNLFVANARDMSKHDAVRDALAERERMFRAVSELTSDYVFSLLVGPDGSLEWEWVTGAYEHVVGESPEVSAEKGGWQRLVHPDDLEAAAESFQRLLVERRAVASEFRMLRPDGQVRMVKSWTKPVVADGRVIRIFGAVQDVTEPRVAKEQLELQNEEFRRLYDEAKNQEAKLRESNSLLRATLDSTADGILVVDLKGRIAAYNRKFREMWRIQEEILEGRDDDRAIEVVCEQLRDPGAFVEKIRTLYDNPEATSYDTLEFKDGRIFERFSQPRILDGRVLGRVWSFRDVTEAREAERQIRDALEALRRADQDRRRLLSHLVRAKEDERNRVASDIHDDSVQVMTSVAIGLERLSRQVASDQRDALARLEEETRAAIARLRKMVFELRPPALDEEGLAAALKLYLEELRIESGIEHGFVDELGEDPPPSLRVVFYRIAQEALTNAKKHSRASRVDVSLARRGGGVLMRIADDGRGFVAERPSERVPGHIGIPEMRERAEMAGGSFRIQSRAGEGTAVEVWIPLFEEASNEVG